MTDAMPRPFVDEFTEVFTDLQFDLCATILDLDPEVGRRVNYVVAELFKQGNGNPRCRARPAPSSGRTRARPR
jgi:hypothetical protein